ncbi:aminotransferase class III-fold pyridoxal phosphate-dependent enzyme [Ovoidimarina sediminis]|uniref:aminotransferase class III-fold pyridoxal phosphate-dependent enzyme n=1 Tax=Ovoidimarina sediminis TaxID=3079856 RepID=UPI00291527C6|nr:aminotransferase class III-fold pyridoxal phosphate-dependent enzyme [Rhodophyticola sp. MJ-SS7]MDU8944190.1 aminotransferase class III-fold pyridoxal phosphate-dependent enzyme [Rhodophyticola sp. MJ-SS7]
MTEYWQKFFRDTWGISGRIAALPGELDLNFLAPDDGLVLKVMRPGCDRALVELQAALHAHLSRSGNCPVPEVVAAKDGRELLETADETGAARLVWAIKRLDGTTVANIRPRLESVAADLGRVTAHMAEDLAGFDHPALDRPLKWDLRRADWIRDEIGLINDGARRAQITGLLDAFTARHLPLLERLPAQAIHNDLNDHNLLARVDLNGAALTGVIDFGDAIRAPVLCDLAIAGAYAALDTDRPLAQVTALVRGFCSVRPLREEEADALWPLVLMRLGVSVVNAAREKRLKPDDPYVTVSERPAWRLLDWARDQDATAITATLRHAAGLDPAPCMARAARALDSALICPMLETDLAGARVADLSVTGRDAPGDPETGALDPATFGEAPVLGRWAEPRLIYTAPLFRAGSHPAEGRRTLHMGLDVFLPAGTAVAAPIAGVVRYAGREDAAQGYGGCVILEHEAGGARFAALYGHLAPASIAGLAPGASVDAGTVFARLGTAEENGGWPPHLHLQLGHPDQADAPFAGVYAAGMEETARALHPNPARLLSLDPATVTAPRLDHEAEAARRRRHSTRNLKLSYAKPLPILRGRGTLLYDDRGRTYLDAYNNVPHVGHAHSHVVAAIARQMALVNTNTRYLQPIWADYAEAITALMPEGLDVVFCVNSGSEANDLALRLAAAASGGTEVIVSRAGYHGITRAAIEISEYKFGGPDGTGRPDHVHVAEVPDPLRGALPGNDDPGPRYADDVARVIREAEGLGRRVSAFISEPFPSVAGQVIPPAGYLKAVYDHVRAVGGICIADEVQTGLWRLGQTPWGFAQQGARPDIVVLGKPVANGHPMGVVVTTREIADAFASRMEFFSTFGGSSVSCAAALAVLDVLRDEDLPRQVERVGARMLNGLSALAARYPLLADVRGMGLFLGVDLARPDGSPATEAAAYIVNRLRENRVLIGSDGPHDNVLKIRPPLVFSETDADFLLRRLEAILGETALQPFMDG